MRSRIAKFLLRLFSFLIPESVARWLSKRWSKLLSTEFGQKMTDRFVEALLRAMDVAFTVSRRYRRNIDGFEGRYVFRAEGGNIVSSASFAGSNMIVSGEAIDDADVTVTFKNAQALWRFLLQSGDVVNSIIADEVEIRGNLNYVYKFGFLASDLTRRLGLS